MIRDKKKFDKKVLQYTTAILEDIKSDFSIAKSLKVDKHSDSYKREYVKDKLDSNPKRLTKLLDPTNLKIAKYSRDTVLVQEDIKNQLSDIKNILRGDVENSTKKTKHIGDLVALLKKEQLSRTLDQDKEVNQVINNYYNDDSGIDLPFIGGGGGDRKRRNRKKRGRTKPTKTSRNKPIKTSRAKPIIQTPKSNTNVKKFIRGGGLVTGIFQAKDYVTGNKDINGKNLAEDGGDLAGSIVGAEIGATIGSVVPVVGTIAGGILGGILGGIGGSKVGKEIYNYFNKDKEDTLRKILYLNRTPTNHIFDSVAVDSRGRPVRGVIPDYQRKYKHRKVNMTKEHSKAWDNWDHIVEGTGRGKDKKIFYDTRGVLTMAGGVNIEAHPEYKDAILSGRMTGQEAMDDIGRKEFARLVKKHPEILDMNGDAQQFALAMAKNVGGGGAGKFMKSIRAFNDGDFDTVRENMKSWRITDNHKRNYLRVMSQIEKERGFKESSIKIANTSNKTIDSIKRSDKKDIEEKRVVRDNEALNKSIDALNKNVEMLAKNIQTPKGSDNPLKNLSLGLPETPQHLEPITDGSLIAMALDE